MLVIGLIGQIGTGKSTAGHFFQALGVPVIDSDHLARALVDHDPFIQQQLAAYFGPHILFANGAVNRAQLRQEIFNDDHKRQWLEQLLHPRIEQALKQQLAQINSPYAIVLLPLLIDRQRLPGIHRLLHIHTQAALQHQRVLQRDAISTELLQKILASQASVEQLQQASDDHLENNGDLNTLQQHVSQWHDRYLRLSQLPHPST